MDFFCSRNENMNLWLTKICFLAFTLFSKTASTLEDFDSISVLPIHMPIVSYTLIPYMWIFKFQKMSLFYTRNIHLDLIFKPAHLFNLPNLLHLKLLSGLLSFYLYKTLEICCIYILVVTAI